jgi:deoxyribodipyrimidine photo-lyase
MLQVVWFKRDLRTQDNAALTAALNAGPTLCIYVLEPEYWQLPDTSNRQWMFIRESLLDLHQDLMSKNGGLQWYAGSVIDVLETIQKEYGTFALHSHEETGNLWTYQRDKNVKKWCQQQGVHWQEYRQFSVTRALNNRDMWASTWKKNMEQPVVVLPKNGVFSWLNHTQPAQDLPHSVSHDPTPCLGRQRGGRKLALSVFESFLTLRGETYRGSISSPITAESACSRLSPYLAYGCLSMRELYQTLQQHQQSASGRWKASLSAFESRLWWHCHFIQKLEDEPQMEINNLHPATDHLNRIMNEEFFSAWQHGRTGWPMVDACMRYLQHYGWINFRMRAMLVSVASFPLWLPWQPVSHWLASLFTDYEPGIHYPQVQMQAGTTGINIPRMYNPITQAQKCDPSGNFVRQWVPELKHVSDQWIFEPWLMSKKQQQHFGLIIGEDYPAPLVDFAQASRMARARMQHINTGEYRATAKEIGQKHGSRKRRSPRKKWPSRASKNEQQLSLF